MLSLSILNVKNQEEYSILIVMLFYYLLKKIQVLGYKKFLLNKKQDTLFLVDKKEIIKEVMEENKIVLEAKLINKIDSFLLDQEMVFEEKEIKHLKQLIKRKER